MQNIQDTLMSQYANSPIICALIENLNECLDPRHTIEEFYALAWNLTTAAGFGLDIWGRIVGINRNVAMVDPDEEYFGFMTSPIDFHPFNQYPFSGAGSSFSTYQLPDTQYKTLILAKAAANILYATAPNINAFLKQIFQGKRAYYSITGHMQATYVFEFALDAFERYIAYNSQILPKPCGVTILYQES